MKNPMDLKFSVMDMPKAAWIFFSAAPLFLAYSELSTLALIILITAGFYLMTAIFFYTSRFLFPDRLFSTAILLWLAVFSYAAISFKGVSAWWILSVALLLSPFTSAESSKRSLKKFFECTAGFIVWTASIAAVKEYCTHILHWRLFENPAGYFLLAAAAFVFWTSHRRERAS